MERKFLEDLDLGEGVKLPKAAIDAIMAENGKDINDTKAKFADYDTIKTRLSEADKKLEGYDPEWKDKADQADKDAKAQVEAMKMDILLREAMTPFQFTSSFARDGVAAQVKAAGLKVAEDGKTLLGFDDLMKSIKEKSPDAFKAVDQGGGGAAGGAKLPFATASTQKPGAAVKPEEVGNLREALGAKLFPKD